MFKKSNPDIILDVDSEYSRIWVRQVETKTTDYKILQVDQGVESYLDTETNEMGAEYLKYYDLFEYYEPQANRALLIGGAGYTYPIHFLNKYTDKTIDVVEIDKKMTQIAQEQFGLDLTNDRIKNYSQDGRSFLNYSTNKYDVVLIDAFKGFNAPFELTTYEAISNIYRLLNNDGILITNIISSIEGKDSNFIKYEYSTYKSIFDDVKVFQVKNADENTKQNLILLGIKGKTNEGEKTQFQNLLNNELKDFGSDKKIVTDDFAPIGN